MAYINFRFRFVLHCTALVAAVFLFARLAQSGYYATLFTLALAILLLVKNLLNYAESTIRDVERFILAIRNRDYSQSLKGKIRRSAFPNLMADLDDILESFRRERFAKEAQAHYLDVVIRHVRIALIALDEEGNVVLMNEEARELLSVGNLRNIKQYSGLGATFPKILMAMKPGNRQVLPFYAEDDIMHLSLQAVVITQGENVHKLISLQNIGGELEAKELEAWQKLVQVLTHEINNSITPIASLADTARSLFEDRFDPEDEEDRETLLSALQVIEKRSLGLMRFVEDYHKLSAIPQPVHTVQEIREMFTNLTVLFRDQCVQRGIDLEACIVPEYLRLNCDKALVEQVLINLVKNALHAVQGVEKPKIKLEARRSGKRISITVADNGKGIVEEALDKIFVPFFKTKRDGSGIGLSLAKQIMRLHGGTISVNSKPNQGTVFQLKFIP